MSERPKECGTIYEMVIDCRNHAERWRIGSAIHLQLKGNKDYIDSGIILNIEEDFKVKLHVCDDATIIPAIVIPSPNATGFICEKGIMKWNNTKEDWELTPLKIDVN